MSFGLTPIEIEILNKFVIGPLKSNGCKVWIFGSRARGDFKKFSDIDVLYSPPNHDLPPGLLSNISEAIEESRLPYKVDLANESQLAASYVQGIFKDRIEV
jgi:predicted nucleotidyltransferase